MDYLPLIADSADYPRPNVSLLPTLPRVALLRHVAGQMTNPFLEPGVKFIQGRYALLEALRRLEWRPGHAVLMPSCHCRSMVEPAERLGIAVRFYPMTDRLQPDFSRLAELVADGMARAMLLTHYFGFPNDVQEARNFCMAHGLAMIEDCSHALYSAHESRPLGTFGDFATASLWKFLPTRDGAVLLDHRGASPTRLQPQPWVAEFKAVAAMARRTATDVTKLPPIDADALARATSVLAEVAAARPPRHGRCSIRPEGVNRAALRASTALSAFYPHGWAMTQRRGLYRRWLDGVTGVAGVLPLFPELPEGAVPYAFPLLADSGGRLFHALRLAGIPIWRWEDVACPAMDACAVSRSYRTRLLQLPCHQDLSEAAVDWMAGVLRAVAPGVLQ